MELNSDMSCGTVSEKGRQEKSGGLVTTAVIVPASSAWASGVDQLAASFVWLFAWHDHPV